LDLRYHDTGSCLIIERRFGWSGARSPWWSALASLLGTIAGGSVRGVVGRCHL